MSLSRRVLLSSLLGGSGVALALNFAPNPYAVVEITETGRALRLWPVSMAMNWKGCSSATVWLPGSMCFSALHLAACLGAWSFIRRSTPWGWTP